VRREPKLIFPSDATTFYGFKVQIRIMAMRIRRWRDNDIAEVARQQLRQARKWVVGLRWFFADQNGSMMNMLSASRKVCGISAGKAFWKQALTCRGISAMDFDTRV
jgi:hypothetical protein